MFFSQYNALLVINSIGYIFKLYMLLKVSLNLSCIFSYPNFLIKKSTLITFSLFLIYLKLVHQWFCATSLFNPPIDPTNWRHNDKVHYFDFGSSFSSMILWFCFSRMVRCSFSFEDGREQARQKTCLKITVFIKFCVTECIANYFEFL